MLADSHPIWGGVVFYTYFPLFYVMAAPTYQAKPFQTFEQQADKLLTRGLLANRGELITLLHTVNYYRLTGYLHPFRQTLKGQKGKCENYIPGTTLKQVWQYYLFDRRLRLLIMDAIERIEIALRTQIAYLWAQDAGCSNPQGDISHYNPLLPNAKFQSLIAEVNDAFNRSRADFIQHHKNQGCTDVKDLPSWIFVELTTMGELTRIYKGLPYHLQESIAIAFGFVDEQGNIDTSFFYSLMSLFQHARNACAHHSRIWNVEWNQHYPRKTKQGVTFPPIVSITNLPMWNQRWVDSQNSWMRKPGKHSFQRQSTAFLLTACAYFINKTAPNSSWKQRFAELVSLPETPTNILTVMKFTMHWRSHPFWNI